MCLTKFFNKITNSTVHIDAKNKKIGRLASDISSHLMGKYNVCYSKNVDPNVTVIVSNLNLIDIDNKKLSYIKRIHHTGYIGNLKVRDGHFFVKNNKLPELLFLIVNGMMPKTEFFKKIVKRRLKFV